MTAHQKTTVGTIPPGIYMKGDRGNYDIFDSFQNLNVKSDGHTRYVGAHGSVDHMVTEKYASGSRICRTSSALI